MQQQSFLKEKKKDPLCCHIWMYDLLKKRQFKLLLIYSASEVISVVVVTIHFTSYQNTTFLEISA